MSKKLQLRNPQLSLKGIHGEVLIDGEWRAFVCSTGFGTVYSPCDDCEFSDELKQAILARNKKAEAKVFR